MGEGGVSRTVSTRGPRQSRIRLVREGCAAVGLKVPLHRGGERRIILSESGGDESQVHLLPPPQSASKGRNKERQSFLSLGLVEVHKPRLDEVTAATKLMLNANTTLHHRRVPSSLCSSDSLSLRAGSVLISSRSLVGPSCSRHLKQNSTRCGEERGPRAGRRLPKHQNTNHRHFFTQ